MKIKYLIALSLAFVISSIFLTIETATIGSENSYLEERQKELLAERKDLETGLVKNFSIAQLSEESSFAGFVKPQLYLYIKGDEQVASLH